MLNKKILTIVFLTISCADVNWATVDNLHEQATKFADEKWMNSFVCVYDPSISYSACRGTLDNEVYVRFSCSTKVCAFEN